jgi:hypothetical protein
MHAREHQISKGKDINQRSFASAEHALKNKRTRREKFLAEMDRVVPWARLIAMIEPLYPTSGRVDRQPIGVTQMLRMYCLQQWYALADEALEDALYDSQATRCSATSWASTCRANQCPMPPRCSSSGGCYWTTTSPRRCWRRSTPASPSKGFGCAPAPSWMRPSSRRPTRPRTPAMPETPRCIRPRRELAP